jgi:hypothetical protein
MRSTDFLARYGVQLADAGYDVLPIAPGTKYPVLKGWESVSVTRQRVEGWIAGGHAHDGVGVRTGRVVGVDIDILDSRLADRVEAWCHARLGFAPCRTGRAPKRLLVYRAETPFAKVQSAKWLSPDGVEHKIEVLADGQQFVAWAIHPETKKPFTWSHDSLLTTPPGDLEELTEGGAREVVAEFERLAAEAGWTRKVGGLAPLQGAVVADTDDVFATIRSEVVIEDDELQRLLMAIEDFDTYETWVSVGMALHHHYEGGETGLDFWREWSAQSVKALSDDALEHKWCSFGDAGGRPTKTARYIIQLGREALKRQSAALVSTLKGRLLTAASLDDLRAAAAEASAAEMDILDRESLCGALKASWRRLEGSALSVAIVRSMLRYRAPDRQGQVPAWLGGWVYLLHADVWYHKDSGQETTQAGFNAMYDRRVMSAAEREAGKAAPEVHASVVALNVHGVRTFANRLYLPGEADEFTLNGLEYVNAYRDHLVPMVPETPTARDRRNIRFVEDHFKLLFPDARERGIFLSFLAFVVQTGRRPNWAVLIQGTEGDGKSFLTDLMGAVLGGNNVKTIAPQTLQALPFNGWAEGSQLAIVEEVKLHGHNRHDVLNSIKPQITNATIEMHRKGKDPYQAPNTQAYILLTNFPDALPLGENDSRYFVLHSRFQTKLALNAFKKLRPSYFHDLFNAVVESAGALRGWLLVTPMHAEFDAKDRAPWSRGRDYMAQMSASSESDDVTTALAGSLRLDVSRSMLNMSSLIEEIERLTGNILNPWLVRRILLSSGWTCLGRFSADGQMRMFWTQTPDAYKAPGGGWDRGKIGERLLLEI